MPVSAVSVESVHGRNAERENAAPALPVGVGERSSLSSGQSFPDRQSKSGPPRVRRCARAAIEGLGIAYVPEDLVLEDLAQGRLAMVLDDWSPFFSGYFLYYPSRSQNSPAFKVVVEALRYRQPSRAPKEPPAPLHRQ